MKVFVVRLRRNGGVFFFWLRGCLQVDRRLYETEVQNFSGKVVDLYGDPPKSKRTNKR